MRIGYLDESGTGNVDSEPFVVVAGVIVHADIQWRPLDDYLNAMLAVQLPNVQSPFFHAKDIWHGSGHFSRSKFPDKWRRRMILRELCLLPRQFELPIVFGYIDRRKFRSEYPELDAKHSITTQIALCTLQCAAGIERYMRMQNRAEVAIIVHENNNTSRASIKEVHNFLKRPASSQIKVQNEFRQYFPIERIIETAHFAEKTDTRILQVADAIAFALARKLREAEDCDYLFQDIRPNLTILHSSWAEDEN